ncbi:hypothetical protein CR513_45142, partial [Mucuna pruriens]
MIYCNAVVAEIIPSGSQPQLWRDTESIEVIKAEAVAVWYAMRNGDRAALASEPRLEAARRAEHERNIDLTAEPAVDAISLSENFRII